MTMDEIHRRVIDMSRRQDRIDAWFAQQPPKNIDAGWMIKVAARPLGPFQLPNLHKNQLARPVVQPIRVHSKNGQGWKTEMWASGANWRPIVRGTRCFDEHGNGGTSELRAYEDGAIVFDWRYVGQPEERAKNMYMEWFAATFGNLLLAIERLRLVANNPVEYGAEVYVGVSGETYARLPYWENRYGFATGKFQPAINTLGRYPIGDATTFANVSKLFETDVCHLAEAEAADTTFFDYSKDLAALRNQLGIAT